MNFRKKNFLLLSIFLIIIIQILLYTNNKQKISFRYLNWTLQEVQIGKIISISFFSGLFISTFLNNIIPCNKKNSYENKVEKNENQNNFEDSKSDFEMPPQRDIRETQPTISVNYRVVKNTEENDFETDQNYSTSKDNKDDWENDKKDW